MKYKLLVFRFVFLDDRYIFPIILNYDDFVKAQKEYNLVFEIIQKLEELPGLHEPRKFLEKVDTIDNLKREVSSIFGKITNESIKSIDVMLKKTIPLSEIDFTNGKFESFNVRHIHLPIRRLDNFNDIEINPFVIIDEK